jgi:hypothetical protein
MLVRLRLAGIHLSIGKRSLAIQDTTRQGNIYRENEGRLETKAGRRGILLQGFNHLYTATVFFLRRTVSFTDRGGSWKRPHPGTVSIAY